MSAKDDKKQKQDRAENLLAQGRFEEAVSLLEDLRDHYPEDHSIEFMLALAYYDGGDAEKAVDRLERLFKQELADKVFTGFAFDELVRIYKQQKDFVRLVRICEDAVSAQPDDVGLWAELGKACLLSGDFSRACLVFEKLVGMEDDNPAWYCDWGEALFAAGLIRESETAFHLAGEIDPENSDNYYFKMAVLFQEAGRHRDAVALLNKCVALKESNPLYYCAMGDSFIRLGELENARMSYHRAIERDRERAGAYYNRMGHAFFQNGYYEAAAEAFEQAIAAEPSNPYLYHLASAYKAMGRPDRADEILLALKKKSR
jgi:tetratricopeptide (TPR) repeat protein